MRALPKPMVRRSHDGKLFLVFKSEEEAIHYLYRRLEVRDGFYICCFNGYFNAIGYSKEMI